MWGWNDDGGSTSFPFFSPLFSYLLLLRKGNIIIMIIITIKGEKEEHADMEEEDEKFEKTWWHISVQNIVVTG